MTYTFNSTKLQSIYVENYKAFQKAYIPIKPITIFIGANSVGKSSITQLLLLLKQTANSYYINESPLKLYGEDVNLGNPLNLFRKMNVSNPIKIQLGIKSPDLQESLKTKADNFIEDIKDIARYIPEEAFYELSKTEITSPDDFNNYITSFGEMIKKYSNSFFSTRIKELLKRRTNINPYESDSTNNENVKRAFVLLYKLKEYLDNDLFYFSFSLSYENKELNINEVCISSDKHVLFKLTITKYGDTQIESDLIDVKTFESDQIENHFYKRRSIFTCFVEDYNKNENQDTTMVSYLNSIIVESLKELCSVFSNDRVNYVSPLRAHPKRYYMLDKAYTNQSLNTLDGDAIAEVIKDNPVLKRRVNLWLQRFDLAVDIEEFKEIIHHLKVQQNNLSLDIPDVGFGISQVLPVIIQGFLSASNASLIIEQPEIHLHPKMQADLADLFINFIQGLKDKRLIIETHSEYILKRLRRRIAEQRLITNNDVSICLFCAKKNHEGSYIEPLKIADKGYFEWPEEFYGGELYNDTIQFLKYQ